MNTDLATITNPGSAQTPRAAARTIGTRHRLRLAGAAAMCCLAVGTSACSGETNTSGGGSEGGSDDVRSELVALMTSDAGGSTPEEDASCIAEKMVDEGFDEADLKQVKGSEEGFGVSSKILDWVTDATVECVPDTLTTSAPLVGG